MKKRNIIIACLLFILILFTTKVNAAEEACKVSLSADKTTLGPGDTVTVSIKVSNVTKTDGISQFIGALDFPSDIFEVVFEEDDETLIADYEEYEGYSIIYSGRMEETVTNPWYIIYAEEEGKQGFLAGIDTKALETVQPVKSGSTQTIGKIKLKVKDGAEGTTASLAFSDMEVFGPNDLSDTTTDVPAGSKISDATINFTLTGMESQQEQEPEDQNTGFETTTGTGTSTNKVNKDNKASNNVPYTGIEDTIPVIFILIVIATLAYINYRKYKNI